jgi:type IV secretion system protein VirD4
LEDTIMGKASRVRSFVSPLRFTLGLIAGSTLPAFVHAQASPFLTGATALETNLLAWLTPVAVILVMVLGAMAMANRMMKSLAARIVFAPKDFPDAREIADELGNTSVRARTVSKPLGPSIGRRGARGSSVSVSEQRRPLLLPQEVKELGSEEAIVFGEGLRPIRCRKIRYFADRKFRKRLRPPPASAVPGGGRSAVVPEPADASREESHAGAADAAVTRRPPEDTLVIREATVEDVERLDSLTMEDFAADLSKVPMPKGEGPVPESDIAQAAERLVDSLMKAP